MKTVWTGQNGLNVAAITVREDILNGTLSWINHKEAVAVQGSLEGPMLNIWTTYNGVRYTAVVDVA